MLTTLTFPPSMGQPERDVESAKNIQLWLSLWIGKELYKKTHVPEFFNQQNQKIIFVYHVQAAHIIRTTIVISFT